MGRLLLLIVGVAIAAALLMAGLRARAARGASAETATVPTGTAPSRSGAAPSATALGAFQVVDLDGALVPVAPPGEPAIVMVSSRTCGWCKRAFKDIGELAAGRPVPRLRVITLEGAAEGVPMLAKERITGAHALGPAGSNDQVLLTFRYPGTPTFVAIDRQGRIAATMPGYPIRPVMEQWFAVMVGDADVP